MTCRRSRRPSEPILTNEPMYVGQPILAVAAVDETTAQDAIDKIKLDLEELPFTVDPLASLFPGGPDARLDGNVIDNRLTGPPQLKKAKWSAAAIRERARRPTAGRRARGRVVVRRRRRGLARKPRSCSTRRS